MQGVYKVLFGLAILLAGAAMAETPTMPKAKVPNPDLIAASRMVENYFNTLTTLQANFSQTQTDRPKETAQGVLYLNRPVGQFLWQYQTPIKQKIIGTGTAVYYVDQSAKRGDSQVTQLPLDAGLGRLLRGETLILGKVGLRVNGVKTVGGTQTIQLAALPTRRDAQGLRRVTLTFNTTATPALTSFAATDMLGVTTQVSFTNLQPNIKLARNLFAFTPGVYRDR